ncbi:MAG: hypothetical protein ACP5DZ_09125 [Bacteroidales bacterium]
MKKQLVLLLIYLWCGTIAMAEHDKWQTGTRSAGMGDASLFNRDVWAGFNNAGALTGVDKMGLGLAWENRYFVNEMSQVSMAFVMPGKGNAVAVSVSHFGYSLYSENRVGLAYAMKLFDWLSMGIQLNYLNTFQPEFYGNAHILSFDAGLLATPSDNFMFGVQVYNPANIGFNGERNKELPVGMRIGVGYWFTDDLLASVEAEMEMANYTMFKAGLEYHLLENFYLRTGVNAKPVSVSFGAGWEWNNLNVDLAYSYDNILGSSPHLGVSYAF